MIQADSVRQETHSRTPRAASRGALWLLRNGILVLALFFIVMWTFMPILWTLSMSFKGVTELYEFYTMPMRLVPHKPTLGNYRWIFEYIPALPLWFKHSTITTLGTVMVRTFCAAMMGYAFARLRFRGRDLIFYSLIAAMFIPRAGVLMAQYELMDTLHLRNSLFGLVLLFASDLSVPLFIMRQNFLSMPKEIEDAARIDGAGRWRLFLEIALPFAASGMLVVAAFTFVNVWGEYLTTLTMIGRQKLWTLGVGVAVLLDTHVHLAYEGRDISFLGLTSVSGLMASVPAILLYVAMQKHFVKGLAEGAASLAQGLYPGALFKKESLQ